jgi:N6-adenosine-specific RNA methylase IME4
MPVRDLAAPDAALFMWTSGPFLHWSMDLLKAWGFAYKTYAFGWVKLWPREDNRLFLSWEEAMDGPDFDAAAMGTGHWTHSNLEIILMGTRNRPERQATGIRQLIVDVRREHSRKPPEAHKRIERLVAGPYVELFARASRKGWDTHGNQRTKFDAVQISEVVE